MKDSRGLQLLSDLVVHTKYARYLPKEKRRETWEELCDRNRDMHIRKYPNLKEEIKELYENWIKPKIVLPSMRSLQFGGKAIEQNHARLYNCSYVPMNHYKAFNEAMFLLLCGCGVGYSVQTNHVDKLPAIRRLKTERKFVIEDSIEGWADAVAALIKAYMVKGPRPRFIGT
jgi:ribonucleoside-diphosphate reductase alpha chain